MFVDVVKAVHALHAMTLIASQCFLGEVVAMSSCLGGPLRKVPSDMFANI